VSAGDTRIAILISGRGSNMQVLIDACQAGRLDATVAVVVSNRSDADGLRVAAGAGIATRVLDHRAFAEREAFDLAMLETLKEQSVDIVLLAGFMRIFSPLFTRAYRGRLLNIHPSLLPRYPGLNTHQRALDAGDSEAGTTVHFVTEELDGGPPVLQARVPIEDGDDAGILAARVLAAEHQIYPIAVGWLIAGRLQLTEKGALLDDQPVPESGIRYEPGTH
jgi:phosphoribosylglycinamide formyltransferase-1